MTALYQRYMDEIRPKLKEELGLDNIMQVPRLEKITLNMGVGEAVGDKKIMDNAVGDLTLISGQKPVVTNARKSEAGFKIRTGWPVGLQGHAATRADVRIRRTPHRHRHSEGA